MIEDPGLGGLHFQVVTELLEGFERALAGGRLDEVIEQDMGEVHPISPGRTSASIPHGPGSHRAVRAVQPTPRQGPLGPAPALEHTLSSGGGWIFNSQPQASSSCQQEEKK